MMYYSFESAGENLQQVSHSFDAELESSLSPKPITEHAVDILTDDDIETRTTDNTTGTSASNSR